MHEIILLCLEGWRFLTHSTSIDLNDLKRNAKYFNAMNDAWAWCGTLSGPVIKRVTFHLKGGHCQMGIGLYPNNLDLFSYSFKTWLISVHQHTITAPDEFIFDLSENIPVGIVGILLFKIILYQVIQCCQCTICL